MLKCEGSGYLRHRRHPPQLGRRQHADLDRDAVAGGRSAAAAAGSELPAAVVMSGVRFEKRR